ALPREPAALHHVDVLRERPHRGEVVICPTVFRGLSDESGFWKNDLDTPMLLGRPAAEWAERGDADTAQIRHKPWSDGQLSHERPSHASSHRRGAVAVARRRRSCQSVLV